MTESNAPALSGLLVIDKPPGFTSMDVCAVVRKKLRKGGAPKRVKVGHGGTLDPMATGVLVVLVGKATPMCNEIMKGEKEYLAEIELSRVSTTDDAEGDVTEVAGAREISRAEFEAAVAKFVGEIDQVPPDFSAVHVGGKRAYALAREGEKVELAARRVFVKSIKVVELAWPRARVVVVSGKGVYIRSLARDIGRALGVGGMLTALRRTRVGEFTIDRAVALAALPEAMGQGDLIPVAPT